MTCSGSFPLCSDESGYISILNEIDPDLTNRIYASFPHLLLSSFSVVFSIKQYFCKAQFQTAITITIQYCTDFSFIFIPAPSSILRPAQPKESIILCKKLLMFIKFEFCVNDGGPMMWYISLVR